MLFGEIYWLSNDHTETKKNCDWYYQECFAYLSYSRGVLAFRSHPTSDIDTFYCFHIRKF